MRRTARKVRAGLRIGLRNDLELISWRNSYFDKLGSQRSFGIKRPVMADDRCLPWMTYSAIEYISQFDLSSVTVFEYGSGYGSIFWAERARKVISVEDNPEWIRELESRRLPNQYIVHAKDLPEYIHAIEQYNETPDIVIIDGKQRRACAANLLAIKLLPALVILDNSDWCPATCDVLRNGGFHQFDFIGPGPINAYAWATSMFVPLSSTRAIPRKHSAPTVTGGLTHSEDES